MVQGRGCEDGKGGHKEPNDHSLRIGEIGYIWPKKTNIKWYLHTNKVGGP